MTAPAPDRRCGTCKWWRRTTKSGIGWWGKCDWLTQNLPASLVRTSPTTQEDDCTDCSQWSDGAEAMGEGEI